MLRKYYLHIHQQCQIPICTIAGMNRLLDIAFDSIVRIGMFQNNPACTLSFEHASKTQQTLSCTHFPVPITQLRAEDAGDFSSDECYFDISVPCFPDIYYVGTDLTDGLNLIRHALVDELRIQPQCYTEVSLKDFPAHSNTQIISLKLIPCSQKRTMDRIHRSFCI